MTSLETGIMDAMRTHAMRNFKKNIFRFKTFGDIEFHIRHMHDDEYAVLFYDQSQRETEILRISELGQPHFI